MAGPKPWRRVARAVAISAAVVTATGGIAWASIPGSDGTIKGCYARASGLLLGIPYSKGDVRVVDSSESCRPYETTLRWNQAGPKGDVGAQGPIGLQGPQGEPGPVTPATRWYSDRDGDGFGDWYDRMDSPAKPLGFVANNDDCNDDRADVNPGTGTNAGVGWDFDCDGVANEAGIWWYGDADLDGWGNLETKVNGSTDGKPPVPGATRRAGDCDDTTAKVTTECRDYDYWYKWVEEAREYQLRNEADRDDDGHFPAEEFDGQIIGDDCDDYDPNVYPGHLEVLYDGLDNDCNSDTVDLEQYVADVGRHDPVSWGIRTP